MVKFTVLMYDLVASGRFAMSGSRHLYRVPDASLPQGKPCAVSSPSHSPLPLPPPLATTNLLSVSLDLPVADTSCQWDQKDVALCVWLLSLSIF